MLLRYLGVEEFGRYGIVLALVGLVQGISDARPDRDRLA